jgi:uncharacterized peroxidase-related enzyme
VAYIKVIHESDAEGELAEVYSALARSRGKVANIMKVHSLNPRAMRAHLELYVTLLFGRSKLKRPEREMIAVVVSQANRCDYCVHHHAEALEHYWGEERVRRLIDDVGAAEPSAREQAMADYARKLTLEPTGVQEDDVAALRAQGLDDSEILDVNLIVSYFNFVNRIALGLGVEFSPEEVEGYRY